ncbi:hypothetical protein CNEO3_350046 [Clostridium neonatale]|uniref:hypothetical protein n=1 Tax=Clostridium neonatale TaxID=137838 RepID=UPI00291B58FD|nr:hypothetical protein CNEO3_330046 [Clostridium neonatale]CAI3652008.1 hypothetical protein CNEO3_380051 [Clostridium neonatale]CAI3656825.1 hypothetical protein CNEO3_350046 [Clostridium neonatale]CAI3681714.1 hypothetical protein CNEO3_570035 [Clostridium neonatale]
MDKQQAIEQLKDLRESQREFIDDNDKDCAFRQDVEALDLAIKVLEGTALEVPVQEQNKITSSLSYGAGNFKSITLYNDKERFERVYEIHENLNSIGLLLTPEVLKFNNINSIDEIFMIGILQDK